MTPTWRLPANSPGTRPPYIRLDIFCAITGPVDLVLAATAELQGLALLHHDRDFDIIARVTGQPLRWYGSD